MNIWRRLGEIFAPRVTITKTCTVRSMTDDEIEAFDDAFAAMDAAFGELDKAFQVLGRVKS